MESFVESLNRLKDIHEKEVLGLQSKLLELHAERGRDAQRLEELFTKNQQLREQQKALKENVRALENRLRAGLCDRCVVTQELARRKQHEFESSHLQSLQHIFLLTGEVNGLQEENRRLKGEVKRLRGLQARPSPLSREGGSDTPSPPPLPSPGGRKTGAEKPRGPQEDAEDASPSADGPPGRRTPPARASPGGALPEPRALDTGPQHISNQLHGTIALVRPGSRACPNDCGATDGTPPPPARCSPPLDSFLRASRAPAATYAPLKGGFRADGLSLLHRHPSLHSQDPRSAPPAPASPRPPALQAGEAWEEPAGLLDPLGGTRDPRLDSVLHALLAQQQLRALGRRARPGGPPPSPPASSSSDSPRSEVADAALKAAALRQGPLPRCPALGSPGGQEAAARVEGHAPDTPLDLSDPGRRRDVPKPTGRPGPRSPPAAQTDSPKPPQEPEAGPLPSGNGIKRARVAEPGRPPTPADPPPPLPGHDPSLPSAGGMGTEACPQRPDANGHPDAEPCRADTPRAESKDPGEPDSSDGEVATSAELGAEPGAPGQGPRCTCAQEHGQGQPRKRRRASDPGGRASRKPPRGRRQPQEALTARPWSPSGAERGSPSPSDGGWEPA
ncbi:RBBP8 N-terminal-like protein [Dasypus novemcinctus]|uniref:RBBP8 N-terminal-like protein n=1 Tax=Dasypus novemcinctus TaxID=9361 RepID=UPI00265ED868|nr:RBBP8 N-terminal-like protein [Dasypus novemcinctus]